MLKIEERSPCERRGELPVCKATAAQFLYPRRAAKPSRPRGFPTLTTRKDDL